MKVWSCVEMFGGVIQGMKVFASMEVASEFFETFISVYGSVEDCDPDWYMNGSAEDKDSEGFFYWNDGNDDAEITIWPVIVES